MPNMAWLQQPTVVWLSPVYPSQYMCGIFKISWMLTSKQWIRPLRWRLAFKCIQCIFFSLIRAHSPSPSLPPPRSPLFKFILECGVFHCAMYMAPSMLLENKFVSCTIHTLMCILKSERHRFCILDTTCTTFWHINRQTHTQVHFEELLELYGKRKTVQRSYPPGDRVEIHGLMFRIKFVGHQRGRHSIRSDAVSRRERIPSEKEFTNSANCFPSKL